MLEIMVFIVARDNPKILKVTSLQLIVDKLNTTKLTKPIIYQYQVHIRKIQ